MPFYDYRCPACSFVKECRHGVNEYPEIICDLCLDKDEVVMQRVINTPPSHFKGNGFYETDYKGK